MNKPWFITGSSRGFSRIWAEAALKRGDKVTATARKLADVADLKERFGDAVLPLALDVTDPEQVQQVVQQAYGHFGRLDVLLNNAGVSLIATVEEASDEQIRDLVRSELLRHGPSPQSRSAPAAATRQRTYPRRLKRPWDCVDATHRLLLRNEMGDRSASRKPGTRG